MSSGAVTDTSHTDMLSSDEKKCYKNWGRGIVDDYKRTIRIHWKEEMSNFCLKTIAVGFFLFFACIAPAM